MANKTKHTADPAAMTMLVWVIEVQCAMTAGWRTHSIAEDTNYPDWQVAITCESLSSRYHGCKFRYRHATLTFDGDGSKCVIY